MKPSHLLLVFSWQQVAHFGELWGRQSFAGANASPKNLSSRQPEFRVAGFDLSSEQALLCDCSPEMQQDQTKANVEQGSV